MWHKFFTISYKYHILIAFLLRIILVIYSQFHDELAEVPYTDVDYKVFTDAARHVINNKSPYERHTYRYTPLIAMLLIPNILIHPSFGKILFSVVDILVGLLIRTIVQFNRKKYSNQKAHLNNEKVQSITKNDAKRNEKHKVRKRHRKKYKQRFNPEKSNKIIVDDDYDYTADYCMLFWIYNPMTFIISTRGNCDSIAAFLVLLTVYMLQCKQKYFLTGVIHGLAVHLRLYPIMYSLSYFMYLSKFGQYSIDQRVTHTYVQKALMIKEASESNTTRELVVKNNDHLNLVSVDKQPIRKQRKTIFKKDYLLYLVPNLDQFMLVSGCFLTLCWLTIIFNYFYGYDFLYETYLYHLVRKDTRHNFSLFFYIQYLTAAIKNIGVWQKVLSFLPQIVLLMVLSVRYGLNKFTLPFSLLTQTIVMVAYNSVVTSQYFIWILAVLPLTLWQFQMTKKTAITYISVWFIAQLAWLYPAYLLEFHGQNTFAYIWLQSVSFFSANMAILGRLIKCYMYKND